MPCRIAVPCVRLGDACYRVLAAACGYGDRTAGNGRAACERIGGGGIRNDGRNACGHGGCPCIERAGFSNGLPCRASLAYLGNFRHGCTACIYRACACDLRTVLIKVIGLTGNESIACENNARCRACIAVENDSALKNRSVGRVIYSDRIAGGEAYA